MELLTIFSPVSVFSLLQQDRLYLPTFIISIVFLYWLLCRWCFLCCDKPIWCQQCFYLFYFYCNKNAFSCNIFLKSSFSKVSLFLSPLIVFNCLIVQFHCSMKLYFSYIGHTFFDVLLGKYLKLYLNFIIGIFSWNGSFSPSTRQTFCQGFWKKWRRISFNFHNH